LWKGGRVVSIEGLFFFNNEVKKIRNLFGGTPEQYSRKGWGEYRWEKRSWRRDQSVALNDPDCKHNTWITHDIIYISIYKSSHLKCTFLNLQRGYNI